jgi:murein DD-endopeptidase MepM/ murein hydrolase activator NlpD
MKIKTIIFSFLYFVNILFSQSVDFKGKFAQGNLVFGKAENVKEILLDSAAIDYDKDGIFVFGIDRDDTNSHVLQIKLKEKTILKKFTPEKSEYDIQSINKMEQKYITPPKAELDRIAKEREISKKARKKIGEEKNTFYNSGFIKPIEKGRISGVFGSQRILNGVPKNAHNGLDIAVPKGTPVKAMTDGIVRLSADNFYYSGNYILLDHGQGLNSFYLHLSKSFVKEGQIVKKGEVIGEVGTTGRSTGPHLHWGVQWFDKRVDPNSVFNFKN